MPAPKTRTEHDLLGSKEVPADAYYGVQTARGLENHHGFLEVSEASDQLFDAGLIVSDAKTSLRRENVDVEIGLGYIDADTAGFHVQPPHAAVAQPCRFGLLADQPYGLADSVWLERALAAPRPFEDLGGGGLPT